MSAARTRPLENVSGVATREPFDDAASGCARRQSVHASDARGPLECLMELPTIAYRDRGRSQNALAIAFPPAATSLHGRPPRDFLQPVPCLGDFAAPFRRRHFAQGAV